MPDQKITLDNGDELYFPDNTPDDVIKAQIMKLQPFGGPQGTVGPEAKQKAQDLVNTGNRDIAGRLSNAATMGASGAQLGSLLGPYGAAAGGVAGAGIGGLLMHPSDTPGTDIGATAGEMIADRMLPGGGSAARRLARIFGVSGATGLGALAGSSMDKTADFVQSTPWGRIGFYSAASLPALALGSFASSASPAAQAASRIEGVTGQQIPLSLSETTGRFGSIEQMLTQGTNQAKNLGIAQDASAQSAFEKIIGAPVSNDLQIIEKGMKVEDNLRTTVVKPWVRQWKQANSVTTISQTPSGVVDLFGNPVMNTTKTTKLPKNVNWQDFQDAFGLSREERDGFFRAIKAAPEAFVNQLMPSGENSMKGLIKLRALMQVMDASGKDVESGNLGQAVVMRLLRGPVERGEALSGKLFAQRVNDASGQLEAALSPDRVQALRDLADVVKTADPLQKVANQAVSQTKRTASYLVNKVAFGTVGMAVGAMAGTQVTGGHMAAMLLGAGAGGALLVPMPAILGAIMTNPASGKLLVKASNGNATAMNKFIRTMMSAKQSSDDAPEETVPSSRSRLQGLFQK